jgi:hypothetical protein
LFNSATQVKWRLHAERQPPMRAVPERPSLRTQRTCLPFRLSL